MAVILENKRIATGVYHMVLEDAPLGAPGQFVMLRLPNTLDPLLGRPISIFNVNDSRLELVYQVVGRGTTLFCDLLPGQKLDAFGPYGNGFPLLSGNATLIGGGIGAAPLYYLAKALREQDPERYITIHLGFRKESWLPERFSAVADDVFYNYGGYVTDDVNITRADTYYACGPTPMLRATSTLLTEAGRTLYVSLESRMACGAGACLGCTVQTANGNRRVCKDGPVFKAEEVFYA
ncbi:MAG: dihydroorotate dehydrogenase electron transfer subunit [Eubacteriales bacterium]|nr:dihydroorotate dehydrogenase electron transfer subunit [Eubacteriales bacterium]